MRFLINIFIIFHLFIITVWLFPRNPQMFAVMNIFRKYIIFLGLDQDYSMFAPYPRKTSRSLFALITFVDQSTALWSCPSMERLGAFDAMSKERYRKYANDNIVEPCFKMFLPDFARYLARLYSCSNNEPETVAIYFVEETIPAPTTKLDKTPNRALSTTKVTNLFIYQVQSNDLQTK